MAAFILITSLSVALAHASASVPVLLVGDFIASNAVRVSACVDRKQHDVIENVNFKLINHNGYVNHVRSKVKVVAREEQDCRMNPPRRTPIQTARAEKGTTNHVLWFEPESVYSANLTVKAYVEVSNRTATVERIGVITVHRAAHHPPLVKQVHINRDGEAFKTIKGPFYDSTVPAPIPFFVPEDPEFEEGDVFQLVCEVEGFPLPKVSWYRDGVLISGDTHNATTVGVYTCVVSNQHGTSQSHSIHLKQAYIGTFSGQQGSPTEMTTEVGNGVRLKCDSQPPCYPNCQIFWYSADDRDMNVNKKLVVINNRKTFLADEGTLVFTDVRPQDARYYRCQLEEQEILYTTVLGMTTRLNVNQREQQSNGNGPRLVYRSNDRQTAIVGESHKLYCLFQGRPSPMVKWYKDDVLLSNRSQILEFDVVKASDAGRYWCEAVNSYAKSERYDTVLRVESKPQINHDKGLRSLVTVTGSDITISCNTSGKPVPNVAMTWNKTAANNSISNYSYHDGTLRITKVTRDNIGIVSCNASNDVGFTYSAAYVNVTEPTVITSQFEDNVYIELNSSRQLLTYICEAHTDRNTQLHITWYKQGKAITTNKKEGITVIKSLLELHTQDSMYGYYECEATNGISSARRGFNIFPHKVIIMGSVTDTSRRSFSQDTLLVVGVSVGLGSILAFIGTFIACRLRRCRKKDRDSGRRSRLSTFSDGTVTSSIPPMINETEQFLGSVIIQNQQSIEKEFPEDMLPVRDPDLRATVYDVFIDRHRILMNDLIGKGQFGRVYAAVLTGKTAADGLKVAVKTLKYKADETEIVDCFLHEAVIMKNFTHPHVLSLTGISFELDGSPMVVLPYMSNGDLRNYIQDPHKDITVLELLKLGLQVARGMMYLSLRKYVHRDLACRNCMVDDRNTVKVADFGLSRDLFSRDYYREASGKRPLPVRWMAPECHHSNLFTTQSDVWSFGILLWELMTRGAVPYPNIENFNVSAHVVAGSKLPQPNYCPTSVYNLMLSCWEIRAEDRHPFHQLVHDIEDIVHSADMGAEESESFYINVKHRDAESDYRGVIHREAEPDYRGTNNNDMTIV